MKKLGLLLVILTLLLVVCIPVAMAAEGNTIELRYDDRKDLSELIGVTPTSVQITNESVTSYQVGTSQKDAHVLIYEDGTLYAVGCGTATLTVNGTSYTVTVSHATLSLFMITGHSIGAGEVGNAAQSVVCEAGQVYSSTKGHLTSANGGLGYGATTRATTKLDAFAPGGGGTKGEDSGLAWQWHNLTGEKVWVLNLAISGSCLNEWQPGHTGHNSTWKYPYDSAVTAYSYAQQIVKKEIAAGHYTLGTMMIIYHNGANFVNYPGWTFESVEENYKIMWESFKEDLSIDMDGDGVEETIEGIGLIPSWKPTLDSYAYDKPAGYYLSASAEYPQYFLASNATRDMLTEEGLKTFPDITYTTQSKAVYKPESILHTSQGGTSDNSLFCSADKAHLSQVGYNMLGIDAANNIYSFLTAKETAATAVEFKNIDKETVTQLHLYAGESCNIIPVTMPSYGNNVTFEISGPYEISYPLIITATDAGNGTLTAKVDGKTVATMSLSSSGELHSHCECVGNVTGHSCTAQNWIPWGNATNNSLPTESGYYYLVGDITIDSVSTIAAGTDIHLCLNGHTITSTSRTFNIKGTLNLTDCGTTGTVTSSSNTEYGAVFYCYVNSVFNLYGGTLTSTGKNLAGSIGVVGNSSNEAAVLNMYGGTITGGSVTHRGGNLYIISGSTLNMYGGVISDGTTESTHSDTSHGGNIYVSASTLNVYGGTISGGTSQLLAGNIYMSSGTLNISGGTITGGSAPNGGNIAIASGKTATVSGGVISDGTATTGNGGNFYTDGGTLNVTGGTFTGGTATRGGSIYITGGKMNMSGGTVESGKATTAAGNIAGYSGSTINISGGTVQNGSATTYGGNVSLSGKSTVNVSGTALIKGGYTGTSGTTGNGGNIYGGYSSTSSYSTINISGGTVEGGKAKEGGNIKFDCDGTISGGTIKGGTATSGGNIHRTSRSVCELVITGGTVSGGSATNGGNIYVNYNGHLTVRGGLITGGNATTAGGNIYGYFSTSNGVTTQSVITIAGGTIENGTSGSTGGNIEIEGTGIITGGTITGGSSETGGNIYVDIKYSSKVVYTSLTMSGGVIKDGNAKYGGNIQTMGIFNMTGGTIQDGKATSTGGNIRVYRPATFTMDDGLITGGSAPSGGNVILSGNVATTTYKQTADFVMNGGTIENGNATNHGGNLYLVQYSNATINGGTIQNGTAGTSGGNIALYPTLSSGADRPATLTTTGSLITGGSASRGGNICVRFDSTATTTLNLGSEITKGSAEKGGNIYIANFTTATIDGATILNGSASDSGSNIFITRSVTDEGFTVLSIRGDTVMNCSGTDLYVDNTSDTATSGVQVIFEELSGKDKIFRVNAAVRPGTFATADADYSAWMVSYKDDFAVTWNSGALSLVAETSSKIAAVYNGTILQAKYASFAQAAEVTGENEYIKLLGNTDAAGYELTGTVWLDMNGYNLTGLTVSGTLYGMDNTTDDYTDDKVGTLTATVAEGGQIATNCKSAVTGSIKRYLTVSSGSNYSFHRFYLGITKVNIRPGTVGIGYKAVFAGSDTVKSALKSYGYTMWINESNKLTGTKAAESFNSLAEVSLRIDHYLDETKSDEVNLQRANTPVNAQVFMELADGTRIESTVISYSFMDMAEMTAAAYDSFTDTQKEALASLGQRFNGLMFDWAVPNIHHQDSSWTAWTSATTLPKSGKIYLETDVTTTASLSISANTELTICLNGHTIESAKRIFNVYGTLNICDCCAKMDEDDQGYIIGKSTSLAPVMYTYYGSTVNIYGGNITATNTVSQAGLIALGNDKPSSATGTGDLVFNMYGGHIYGGNVTGNGGNIIAYHGGTMNMYGGKISGGTANNGGNLYVNASGATDNAFILNLYGGVIEGGTAATSGGNIYGATKTELHIYEGTRVENGKATSGGNVYAASTEITMDGGLLTDGRADNGGNIAFSGNVNAQLENGTLYGGRANNGGNVYIKNIGTFVFDNMIVADGYADNDGGNIYIYRDMYGDTYKKTDIPVITLKDTQVTGATAVDLGSGIYNNGGELIISGSTKVIENNGSNLFLDAGQTVSLKDLNEDALIGITMSVTGKISQDTAYAGNLICDDPGTTISVADDFIIMLGSDMIQVPEITGYSVGWYRGIVTSPFPVPLDGMGNNVGRMDSYKIVSELMASMVVIADETGLDNAVIMCTMDTIVIPEEFCDDAVAVISDATGIPADRIFIAGTHTHAAVSLDENHPSTVEYLQWVYPLLAEYAVLAVEDLAPVASTQMIRTVATNMTYTRRYVDADGNAYSAVDGGVPSDAVYETIADTELQAIRFNRNGKDNVILVNFQSHPGHDASASNGNVSSEIWGAFRESVEAQMPGNLCAFFIGAAANQNRSRATSYVSADGNTYDLTKKQDYGDALAAHLIEAFKNPTAINTGTVNIQVAHYDFDAEGWYETSFTGDRTRPLSLNAVAIGDFAFITAPYEMFHENGEQLKDFVYDNDLFKLLFVISNSNGANKYVASYGAFENDETDGKLTSFEVRQCRFNKGIAEAFITCHAQMLAQLSGKGIEAPNFLEEAKNN